MAEEIKTLSIYEKLLAVRDEFYKAGAKKTGKNLHAEFMYFELADIVPIASELFKKYGLLMITTFENERADAQIVNVAKPEEVLVFTVPLKFIAEPAKFRMNEIQGVGAAITYYRRYLYMIVLDLVEADEIDGDKVPETPAPKKTTKKKAPATTAERAAIKEELTDTEGEADELLIAALKSALKELLELDPEQEEFVQSVALKTESFTKITRSACEELIQGVKEMLKAYKTED